MAKQNKNLTPKSNATEVTTMELFQKTCAALNGAYMQKAEVEKSIGNAKAIIEDLLDNHREEILGDAQKVVCENITVGLKYSTKENIDKDKFKPEVIMSAYPEVCEIKIKIAQVKAYFKNPKMKEAFEALGYSLEEKEEYDISKAKVINIS